MKIDILDKYKEVEYDISSKKDGNMKVGVLGTELNRKAYFNKRGLENKIICKLNLVHGTKIVVVDSTYDSNIEYEGDGFVTNQSDIILSITVGDCFPIYLYDPKKHVIGIAHAGWRGIVNGIISNFIQAVIKNYDSNPNDIIVGIGPGIQKCHFIVKNDVIPQFKKYSEFIQQKDDEKYFVDLSGIIQKQLKDQDVTQFKQNLDCTYCNGDQYFSYRRDKPQNIEAMLAYIIQSHNIH
ncbi:MAG: peptidoglycan editing factor PgeF [bacterium]|nr:peptidoglycan editing factor PgeF [bacterium]